MNHYKTQLKILFQNFSFSTVGLNYVLPPIPKIGPFKIKLIPKTNFPIFLAFQKNGQNGKDSNMIKYKFSKEFSNFSLFQIGLGEFFWIFIPVCNRGHHCSLYTTGCLMRHPVCPRCWWTGCSYTTFLPLP